MQKQQLRESLFLTVSGWSANLALVFLTNNSTKGEQMQVEILKDSEVLGSADFKEVAVGVYVDGNGRVVVLGDEDTGLLIDGIRE